VTKRHFRAALPVVIASILTLCAARATAQQATPADAGVSQEDELARQATDPTASPMNFAFINVIRTDYSDLPDGTPVGATGYDLKFQPVLPFRAWGVNNILRMTAPFHVSGPGPKGLADITIFDLLIFQQSWGRLGLGAVGSFPARTSDVSARAAGGPALGFVATATKQLNLGLFSQNLFGDGVALSQLQPIAAYQLGSGWSLSLGDLQFLYDWNRSEWLSLPIGVQLGKVLPICGQPMRFAVNPQYDFKRTAGAPRLSVSLTVQILLPQRKG
jgi:hypothetical protein